MRGLGVSSAQRSALTPDLPTLSEAGLPGYEVIGWNGLNAPDGTPRGVVARINAEIVRSLKQADMLQRLKNSVYDPAADYTAEQFNDFMKREITKWARVVKESGAKVD